MTWLIPKEEIGRLGVVSAWMPFLQLLSLNGIDASAYHYVAKGLSDGFRVGILYRLRWSLLASLSFLALAAYWAWRGDPAQAWLFAATGVMFPLTNGLTACAGILGARRNFTGLFWYRLGESLTDFTGFIPLLLSIWWVNRIFTFYLANQAATALMLAGVALVLVRSLARASAPRLEAQDARDLARYGRHLTVMNGISVLQARADLLLVGIFLPFATTADYTIALMIADQLKNFWTIYLTVRYPAFVRLPTASRPRVIALEGAVVWIGFFGIAGLLALAAHWLIPLLLPPAYRSSLGYLNWLLLAFPASVPGLLAETYFRTEQDEKSQYRMRIAGAVAGLAFSALLLPRLGILGILLAKLLAGAFLSIFGVGLAIRKASALRRLS